MNMCNLIAIKMYTKKKQRDPLFMNMLNTYASFNRHTLIDSSQLEIGFVQCSYFLSLDNIVMTTKMDDLRKTLEDFEREVTCAVCLEHYTEP